MESPKITPKAAIEKGITYSAPFKIKTTLINKRNEESIEQEVFFCKQLRGRVEAAMLQLAE